MRTYWLSFVNPALPKGQRHLGCVVVDVTEWDATRMLQEYQEMYDRVEGPWLAAAQRNCWTAGCNPGGQISACRLDTVVPSEILATWPRLQLLSHERLRELGMAR